MKKYLIIIALCLSTSCFASHSWNGRILLVSTQKEISIEELTMRLGKAHTIILGEKHKTPAVQLAQSLIINNVVKATHKEGLFITAWEFLNYTDQEKINAAYARFLSGNINASNFLVEIQGTPNNASYIPILETTKALQGKLIGVNISREAKEPVVKDGIDAIDPKYLPPNFAMGSTGYHERFVELMSDHTSQKVIENYYAAQCLTDDVMAYTIQNHLATSLIFLIVGSFHTDYYDGVVDRIHTRLADRSTAVVRVIDASDYDEKELQETLSDILYNKTYGNIADYVYFVNEPISTDTVIITTK